LQSFKAVTCPSAIVEIIEKDEGKQTTGKGGMEKKWVWKRIGADNNCRK